METVDDFDPKVDFPRHMEMSERCVEWGQVNICLTRSPKYLAIQSLLSGLIMTPIVRELSSLINRAEFVQMTTQKMKGYQAKALEAGTEDWWAYMEEVSLFSMKNTHQSVLFCFDDHFISGQKINLILSQFLQVFDFKSQLEALPSSE